MKKTMLLFSFVAVACALMAAGCTKKSNENSKPVSEMSVEELAQRGRSIYVSNCAACHNVNPAIDGSIGPAVAGSSQALLEARIMRAAYPADYKPKRETKTMIALPHLEKEIPSLAAYLGQTGETK